MVGPAKRQFNRRQIGNSLATLAIPDRILRHPKIAVVAFVLATLVLSLGIVRVQFVNQFERDLPEDDPILRTNRRFEEIFGERDLLMMALVNDEGIYNRKTLTKLLAITREVEGVQGVIPGSVKSLCTVKNIRSEESGLDVAPFFEEAPLTDEEALRVRELTESNFMSCGRLVSSDGTAVALRASLVPGHNVAKLHKQMRAIADRYSGPERIFVTGDTLVDYEVTSSMRKDVAILFPISLLLVVGILIPAFRRIDSVVVPSVAVLATVAATLGLMGYTGMPVTVVGSILPVVIVAVVSAYGIHVVNAFGHELAKGAGRPHCLRGALGTVSGPVAISALTSAIGFGSLVTFKIRSIHDFGLILAFAITFGLISSLVFIPAAFALIPFGSVRAGRARRSRLADWLIVNLYERVQKRGKTYAFAAAVGFVLAIVATTRLKVGLEPAKFFPEGHPTRKSLDVFNRKLGGSTCFNLMVEADEREGIIEPSLLRKMDEFQEFAKAQEHVGYATSFVDIMRRLDSALGESEGDTMGLPVDKAQAAQYLLLYSMSGDPSDFEDIVDYDYQRAKMIIMLNTYDDAEHQTLYQRLREKASEIFGGAARVEFGGRAMILIGQDRYIVTGKILNIICSVVIVWLVCTLYFRSFSGGLLSIIPLCVSTVYTFGVMGLTGMRLNIATAMTTGIAVGVGVDFAVHYIHRFREEYQRTGCEEQAVRNTLMTAGKGIVFNTVSVSCGFLIFLGSRFQALRDFGWLIALTMLTCAAGTLLFLPPLIRIVRPYFIYKEEPEFKVRALSFLPLRIPVENEELVSGIQRRISLGLRRISHYF
ncbi:RND family transporter [Candidatus Poribacteria bacterium]|nr:RND family transporter [Candidatus Poribacteria bacterium]